MDSGARNSQGTTSHHFTVVIPCRNRADYLKHTLRTCTNQDYDKLDIVVSDDGSTDHTRDVVADAIEKDSRVRLITHERNVGMRDNFEFALHDLRPGFVFVLGGDDGILPNGIADMNQLLSDSGLELMAWPAPIFSYPGVRNPNGQLVLYRPREMKTADSNAFLRRQASQLNYLGDVEAPMIYVKGVASTRLVERVRKKSPGGRFYSCATPDGYSGIVLAGEVDRYVFSGRPYALHGLSPSSQGLAYLSNDERAKKTSAQFFDKVSEVPMHRQLASLPYSPLITLMTADYVLRASDLDGWAGPTPEIDFRKVIVRAISELQHGLYGDDRVLRELHILRGVAEKHNMVEFFCSKLKRSRRKPRKEPFSGNGLSRDRLFLDAADFRITNVQDAAAAAYHYYNFIDNAGLEFVKTALFRSIRYKWASFGKGDRFPDIDESAKRFCGL